MKAALTPIPFLFHTIGAIIFVTTFVDGTFEIFLWIMKAALTVAIHVTKVCNLLLIDNELPFHLVFQFF